MGKHYQPQLVIHPDFWNIGTSTSEGLSSWPFCSFFSWKPYLGVSKNRGENPKMDGENIGNPNFLMDDLGGKPTIFGNIHI